LKILHAALHKKLSSGIYKQMQWEQAAAIQSGLAWDTRIFTYDEPGKENIKDNIVVQVAHSSGYHLFNWSHIRSEFYKWLASEQDGYDVVLLRYAAYDPLQYWFLRRARKPVLTIHHTLEIPELLLHGGLKGKLKAMLDTIIGVHSLRRTAGLIGVTDEILRYEVARAGVFNKLGFIYPNGAQCEDERAIADERYGPPRLLFVASQFYPWHGLDVLLREVRRSTSDFYLDVVGDVREDYRAIIGSDPRVNFHGRLSSLGIKSLAARAWVGLSSFSLYRNKMAEACPLKVREYLMMGIPVYAGHKDVFPENFDYFQYGPCDMSLLLDFALTMKNVSRATVSEESRPFIDKAVLVRRLYEKLQRDLK
jgi:glycosyltransferase involved in cell wall biosynthesis